MSTTTVKKTTATADVDKTGSTVTGRFTIKNLPTFDVNEATKPLFAAVGVADLWIEQAKEVPADVTARVNKVSARLSEVPAQVKALPNRVEQVTEKATDLYTQLTVRGERLVKQIRRQPATEAAIAEGKEAVRKAEAAATAAKKSAKAGERAVEDAAAKIG